ncbi:MAG: ribosome silencing factor [Nitrospinota bacterium]
MQTIKEMATEQKELIQLCYNAIVEKKGEEILVLDIRGLTSVADFFVICHGTSSRQVLAISDNVEKVLRKGGFKKYHIEGKQIGSWVLMDFSDLIVHIFNEPTRGFYALEKLWFDARKLDMEETSVGD